MDERKRELVERLKERIKATFDGPIAGGGALPAVIREAWEEASVEARGVLKDLMVQAILEGALGELEGTPAPAGPASSASETPLPTTHAETSCQQVPGTAEEETRKEIAAIRNRMAENEQLLQQIKAPAQNARELEIGDGADISGEEEKEEYGYYIYGIVGGNGDQPRLPKEGIDPDHPVYALPHQEITALVSRVSLREFGQEALKANLEDITWLEAKVRTHHGVLETASISHTVIPMRFCTIYQSEERVHEMLAECCDGFVSTLERLRGQQEWGIKVYYDSNTLTRKVEQVSVRVQALAAEMEQKSSGVAYFMRKKQEGMVAEEVERLCVECAQHSHDRLASRARDAVINPLQNKELTGANDEMILNGAYLVAEEQLAAFRAELENLKEEYGDLGFSYAMTGPWPPYNFLATGEDDEPVSG